MENAGYRRPSQGPSMGAVVFVAILFGLMAGFCGTLLAMMANQQGILLFTDAAYEFVNAVSRAPITAKHTVGRQFGRRHGLSPKWRMSSTTPW